MIEHQGPLLERAAETTTIDAALAAAAAGRGGVVLVRGSPGIGKTALLHHAGTVAAQLDLRVLAARGTQLEQPVGFGVARQLLRAAAREILGASGVAGASDATTQRAAVLPDAIAVHVARRAAIPLGLDVGPGVPRDPRDAEQDLLELVEELTSRAPLVVIVDDAHWADEPSLRVLTRLADRHDRLPVLLAAASRPAEDPGGSPGAVALLRVAGAQLLDPAPLSDQAAATLVQSVVADAGVEEIEACRAAARGNPLWLRELAVALPRRRRSAADRVPPTVAAAVQRRLNDFGEPALRLARAVAIFEPRATLDRCARLADLDWEAAVAAADALSAAAVIEHGPRLRFVHPIVRLTVQEEIAPALRGELHAGAATLLRAEGAELDAIAAHLLQAPPRGRPEVITDLARAAAAATARGAPETAIACLCRALAEPPPRRRVRAELLLELGRAEMLIGAVSDAERDLRAALVAADGELPALRLSAAVALCQLLAAGDRLAEGVGLLDAELSGVQPQSGGDEPLDYAETVLLNVARMDAGTRERTAGRAQRLRDRVLAGSADRPEQLATVAAGEAQAGESAQRTGMVAARALDRLGEDETFEAFGFAHATRALIAADLLDQATAAARRGLELTRRRGARFPDALLGSILAEARYRAGDLTQAEQLIREALRAAESWDIGRPAMLATLVRSLIEQGRVTEAQDQLAGLTLDVADAAPPQRYPLMMALQARGRCRLASGDPAGALLDLERCGDGLAAYGEPNPALIEWRSDLAWTLLALGDGDRARCAADDEVAAARRYGAPRPIAIALRAQAATRDSADRREVLREAAEVVAGSPARLVRAEVLADLGVALGRGPEARDQLAAALELADGCAAAPLRRRIRRALARTGARPRRAARSGPAALTASERRVAELAARGLTNREIAAHLVVTLRTVELHLTHAYRKLGIGSRAGLPRALAGSDR